jgi:hypothetical protein
MNRFLIEAVAYMATAQAGAEKMNRDLRERYHDKWEKSKQLPRKAKKLMRKDALLDLAFAQDVVSTTHQMFGF